MGLDLSAQPGACVMYLGVISGEYDLWALMLTWFSG